MTLHDQLTMIRKIDPLTEKDQEVCVMSAELEALHADMLEAYEKQACLFSEAGRLLDLANAKASILRDRIRMSNERFESAEMQGKVAGVRRKPDGKIVLTLDPLVEQPDERQQMMTMLQEILAKLSSNNL